METFLRMRGVAKEVDTRTNVSTSMLGYPLAGKLCHKSTSTRRFEVQVRRIGLPLEKTPGYPYNRNIILVLSQPNKEDHYFHPLARVPRPCCGRLPSGLPVVVPGCCRAVAIWRAAVCFFHEQQESSSENKRQTRTRNRRLSNFTQDVEHNAVMRISSVILRHTPVRFDDFGESVSCGANGRLRGQPGYCLFDERPCSLNVFQSSHE